MRRGPQIGHDHGASFACGVQRDQMLNHGWTRMDTDKCKAIRVNPCASVVQLFSSSAKGGTRSRYLDHDQMLNLGWTRMDTDKCRTIRVYPCGSVVKLFSISANGGRNMKASG
jgi:hypothetical protein